MTTRHLLLPLVLAALPAAGCTVTGDLGGAAEVMRGEQAWAGAMQAGERARLEPILADEFRLTFIDADAPVVTREQWLSNLAVMSFGPVSMVNPTVTLHGDDVATVRMRMTLEDWYAGDHRLPPDYDVTDTWIRRDGRWQVVSRISEPVNR